MLWEQIPTGISVEPWPLSHSHWLAWHLVLQSHKLSSLTNESNTQEQF